MTDGYKIYTSSIVGIEDGGTDASSAAEARKNLDALGYAVVPELLGGPNYASTEFLPLVGGTLTGDLVGVNATFSGDVTANQVFGAVWNDYAEYRELNGTAQPGRCVVENGADILMWSQDRLMPCAYIISDTFGFAIGKTETANVPVAVAGRVLAYTDEPREQFKLGDVVCSGRFGTVSKMTRKEIMMYPERIIGTVACVPNYDSWGIDDKQVQIDNRIWIKLK